MNNISIAKYIRSAFMAIFFLSGAAGADNQQDVIPASYFGLHIHRAVLPQPWLPHGKKITRWPRVQFGSWRLWDAYVAWPSLEPEQGKWSFATLDKYVSMAAARNVDIVLPLGLTPTWAAARPDEPSGYRPGNASEPKDIELWRNYVQTVASRYKGQIHYYELWNEVNVKTFFSGDQEHMLEMAKVAYQTLKAIDSNNVLVAPSVVGNNVKWLDDYFAMGGGQYADVISYHFYVPQKSPEAMLPRVRELQAVMKKYHVDTKPLWNTETGWAITNLRNIPPVGSAAKDWLKLDDRQSSAYVARALIVGWYAGISRFYWYAWDNIDMGLIQPDTKALKPAAIAYGVVAKWLTDSILGECGISHNIWLCELTRGNGTKAKLIWNGSDQATDWHPPSDWRVVSIESLSGTTNNYQDGSINIDLAPVLLNLQ